MRPGRRRGRRRCAARLSGARRGATSDVRNGFRGARSRYGALLQGLTVAAVHVLRTSRGAPTRMVDGVRTRRDAPGRGPRCHCGTARPAIVALRAAATSAPRAHPRCRRAGAVKPCRSGAHGPAGARPGKGASEHGQANNDAWLNNDTAWSKMPLRHGAPCYRRPPRSRHIGPQGASEMPSRGCGEALQIRGARSCRCAARQGRQRTRPGKQRRVVEQRYMATGGRPGRRR